MFSTPGDSEAGLDDRAVGPSAGIEAVNMTPCRFAAVVLQSHQAGDSTVARGWRRHVGFGIVGQVSQDGAHREHQLRSGPYSKWVHFANTTVEGQICDTQPAL